MELYILNKSYKRVDIVEEFESLIWTERFYGDSECEVVVPLHLIGALTAPGNKFLAIDQSKEIMLMETFSVEEGKLKIVGISVLTFLNNRLVRTSKIHKNLNWKITNQKAGQVLWTIVREMCTTHGSHLGSYDNTGIPNSAELAIPKLNLSGYDKTGRKVKSVMVPYGPVYDALRKIAEQYKIGMQIFLNTSDYSLRFRSYKGTNRTSDKAKNPSHEVVRFSPAMDSFSSINELRSVADYKTLVYSYASALEKVDTGDADDNPDAWLQTTPGVFRRGSTEGKFTGFDLRVGMTFEDNIQIHNDLNKENPKSTLAGKRAELLDILNNRAQKEINQHPFVRTVDGEVAPTNLYQYGEDYELGDVIEVEGLTGITEVSRVTEYIRAHDANGERSYPTVEAIDP